ncbi:MerR family transcriptional regulator [Nakamurella leprariae]|uniref:MerR family transcriptional regulator n=1 Tax=Nakamurella leprariae TaxID=2803911 RepID=UPI0038B40F26
MLSIGEFAQVTHLSIRTLRRYHDAGLLEPVRVDPATGYRRYDPTQIPTAQVIHRLRQLDVPLADVRNILHTDDADARAALVAEHLGRLEDRLEQTRTAVASLRRLLRPEPGVVVVDLRRESELPVAAVTVVVDEVDVLDAYAAAMAELDAAVPAPAGPPGGMYDNELFSHGRGRAVIYLPVDATAPPAVGPPGRVRAVTRPAADLAVTVHPGPHDTIDVTYGRLGGWVVEHALAVAGPVHERYLVGPRDTPDPDRWRTEIGWPVFRLAGAGPAGADRG